jgi:hypothetical protein
MLTRRGSNISLRMARLEVRKRQNRLFDIFA